MTPEDSWGATELRAPSPAIGWYDDNETTSDSLQTEFLIDPEDVRLQERIAVGGFAEVFRGTWQGTVVAVKQLLERSSEVKTTLEREVEVLAKLRHPNLLLFMGYLRRAAVDLHGVYATWIVAHNFKVRKRVRTGEEPCGRHRSRAWDVVLAFAISTDITFGSEESEYFVWTRSGA